MAIHHWDSISEVYKLAQSFLIPGVIEENIYRGPLLGQALPVAWTPGKTIKFNRELGEVKDDVATIDIGDQLSWSSNVTYQAVEVTLKRMYVARILDTFIADVYGTINDYEAQVLQEMKKGLYVTLNDKLIYGDLTYSGANGEFDGMHAWVEGTGSEALVTSGTGVNYDGEGAGLNFVKLRTWVDSMKLGADLLYAPFEITRRLSAAVQEVGFNNTTSRTTSTVMAQIQYGMNDFGKRIMFWDGIPIVPSDYMVAEQENTGQGSNARAKNTSGDKQYSIFAIKFGNVFNGEGGISYGFGATNMAGDLYKLVPFENLEDYDASGLRLVSYGAMLLGSKYGLGRMCDIEDVEVIVT